jgi:hypothetical protein
MIPTLRPHRMLQAALTIPKRTNLLHPPQLDRALHSTQPNPQPTLMSLLSRLTTLKIMQPSLVLRPLMIHMAIIRQERAIM